MKTKDALDRVAEAIGKDQPLAEALGVSPQVLSNWKDRGVPARYCARIAKLSNGAVSLQELRPDDWHDYWPDLPAPAKRRRGQAEKAA